MSSRNIKQEILLSTIRNDIANGTKESAPLLQKNFPLLSDKQCFDILELVIKAIESQKTEKVSLVVTAPPSFTINAKATVDVVENMIRSAKRNILITSYSLSSYFEELIDIIIQKSQQGVFVKFFVNDLNRQKGFGKILRYKGKFLKIYNFHQSEDNMSALHAKVISVDQEKTLITSANLSYHGQQGNIEIGTLIESKSVANQIEDVFTKLVFSKIFLEI